MVASSAWKKWKRQPHESEDFVCRLETKLLNLEFKTEKPVIYEIHNQQIGSPDRRSGHAGFRRVSHPQGPTNIAETIASSPTGTQPIRQYSCRRRRRRGQN